MKKLILVLALAFVGTFTFAQDKNVVEAASASKDHTTLVSALKAAALVETLQGAGPFTVFAPTNAAFDKLPDGTVANLLKPENKPQLTKVLTYHVLSGKFTSEDVVNAIKKGNGQATFKAVSGDSIIAMLDGDKVVLKDEGGNTSTVVAADLEQSNGIIHVVDTVVLPQ
ncbi:MAG: fasciclin domain-containing protein [Thermonemataceae bacterium]